MTVVTWLVNCLKKNIKFFNKRFFFGLTLSATTNCEINERIYGGYEVNPKDYPFMIALIEVKTKKLHCGGTLVTPSIILTAAHCIL